MVNAQLALGGSIAFLLAARRTALRLFAKDQKCAPARLKPNAASVTVKTMLQKGVAD